MRDLSHYPYPLSYIWESLKGIQMEVMNNSVPSYTGRLVKSIFRRLGYWRGFFAACSISPVCRRSTSII